MHLYLRQLGNTNSNAGNCTVHRETICDLDCSLRFTVVESNMNLACARLSDSIVGTY